MIRRPRPPYLLIVLVTPTVFWNILLIRTLWSSGLHEAHLTADYFRLAGLSVLYLLPSLCAWMLLLWKHARLSFVRIRRGLGAECERAPWNRFTYGANAVAGLGYLVVATQCVSFALRSPLFHRIEVPVFLLETPALSNLWVLWTCIFLIAVSRFAILSARVRELRKVHSSKRQAQVDEYEFECLKRQDPQARIAQAKLGLAALPGLLALQPDDFNRIQQLDRYFEAVLRTAELADAVARLGPMSDDQAAHQRERAREILAGRALTDQDLAWALVPDPEESGEPLTLSKLHTLLGESKEAEAPTVAPAAAVFPEPSAPEPEAPQPEGPVVEAGGPARWVTARERIRVQGFVLEGGLFYIGQGLWSVSADSTPEPALIDPSLRLDPTSPARSGRNMPARPAYSELSPSQRAAYLEWLSEGRQTPGAFPGYVFLFFYGLERRLGYDRALDQDSVPEWLAVRTETARLLDLYEEHEDFAASARSWLSWIDLQLWTRGHKCVGQLASRIEVGELARNSQPVPAQLALEWARTCRRSQWPASARAGAENQVKFDELFVRRYVQSFDAGLVSSADGPRLASIHLPASPSLAKPLCYDSEWPDVNQDENFVNRITELIERCSAELAD